MIRLAIILSLSILYSQAIAADTPPCSQSGTSSDPLSSSGSSCNSSPDVYQIELYEAGLCNNIDPTNTSTLPNISSNCIKFFVSPTAIPTQISNSLVSSDLTGGTYSMPPAGTYAYGYVKATNKISIKTTKYFDANVTGDNGTSGVACWTRSGTNISGPDQSLPDDPTVDCGSAPSPQFYDKLYDAMYCESSYYCANNTRAPNSYLYLTRNGAYTEISNSVLSNNYAAAVTPNEIMLFYRFDNPINVSNASKSISLLFEVSDNLKVRRAPVSLKIRTFGFKMSAE